MNGKKNAALLAVRQVRDGMTVGLGTGSTAGYAIERLGELVKEGLSIRGVATSRVTESLALGFGIPLVALDEAEDIDLAIDGVDEVDTKFYAVKGGGGALLREKIVASLSRRVIWIMGEGKMVGQIGSFPLPLEVLPFGHTHLLRVLGDRGFSPVLRMRDSEPFRTDNDNFIIDLRNWSHADAGSVKMVLDSLPGVLETGLFLNMCDSIVIGDETGAREVHNPNKREG